MGRASIETLAVSFVTLVFPDDKLTVGKGAVIGASGQYILKENWKEFNIGNAIPFKLNAYGQFDFDESYNDRNRGSGPFSGWENLNDEKIESLRATLPAEIDQRLNAAEVVIAQR